VNDPDDLLSAMMDELLPQIILKKEGNTKSRYADQLSIDSEDLSRNRIMTYEDKVRLFKVKRYLIPLPPLRTKNWTVRDYIRYIDQHGRWCPDGQD
jgi:hypothetical protein